MSTDFSDVRAASIIREMMESARTSDTSADIQLRARQYIPEDSELGSIWLRTGAPLVNKIISL
jgi:hypothetical protein